MTKKRVAIIIVALVLLGGSLAAFLGQAMRPPPFDGVGYAEAMAPDPDD